MAKLEAGACNEELAELFLPEEAHDPNLTRTYKVLRQVTEGGMGKLFLARRLRDGRRVAIKVLHRWLLHCGRSRELMLREAHALTIAAHPLVVELLQYGETVDGLPFLVMEWLDGKSLHAVLVEHGPLPLAHVESIFCRLLDALEVVHARDVVHADLKPENVMLVRLADGQHDLRLVDFGVSSIGPRACAAPGEVHGTPGYLAPEVLRGEAPTPASDLYAAGVILFELLTGHTPFVAPSLPQLLELQTAAQLPCPSSYRPSLPYTLDMVTLRALAPDPSRRHLGIPAFRDAVRAAVALGHMRGTAPSSPRPVRDLPTLRLRQRRTRRFPAAVTIEEAKTLRTIRGVAGLAAR